jgi:hypothetical protein
MDANLEFAQQRIEKAAQSGKHSFSLDQMIAR